jgi:hypothetical protein
VSNSTLSFSGTLDSLPLFVDDSVLGSGVDVSEPVDVWLALDTLTLTVAAVSLARGTDSLLHPSNASSPKAAIPQMKSRKDEREHGLLEKRAANMAASISHRARKGQGCGQEFGPWSLHYRQKLGCPRPDGYGIPRMRWSSLLAVAAVVGQALSCTCTATPVASLDSDETTTPAVVEPRASIDPDLLPPGQTVAAALPIVELSGNTRDYAVTLVDGAPQRVYSRALRTWVYERPNRSSAQLGYLRVGGSAPVNGPAIKSADCAQGWQPIKPTGFVCINDQATYTSSDPIVELTREHPPEFGRKLPYIYGTVRKPGPTYARLPDRAALHEAEPGYEERIPEWLNAGGEIGAAYAPEVWLGIGQSAVDPAAAWSQGLTAEVPELLQREVAPGLGGQTRAPDQTVLSLMRAKTGYAFLRTFWWQGRRYGLTPQMELVPVDRLRPIRGSDFHGYVIGKDVDYPFALVRSPAAKYRSGTTAPYRAAIALSGKQAFYNDVLHYETKTGEWISDRFASRLDPPKKLPGWAKQGEKWIDVNVTKQTLVLYEGETPVYATLVSTGEAGLSDHQTTTATKLGIFRIHTKHVTSTMSSEEVGEEFELREVPYVMYFDKEGYALHGAYWHDRFGIPKSHGCINLAPEDARRIFHWTEPALPLGWHGVLLPLKGTVLFIHA